MVMTKEPKTQDRPLTRRLVRRIYDRAISRIMVGWCQGRSARDARGHKCNSTDPQAVRFCAYGAVRVEAHRVGARHRMVELLSDDLTPSYPGFNDVRGRRRTQVAAFLKRECDRICATL